LNVWKRVGGNGGEVSSEIAEGMCGMSAKTVLVIDDNRNVLELMKEHLLDLGVKPILADNAQQGIDTARRRKPDLLLLDVMMPEMTGGEVAAALKRDPETAHIPIIFISGLIDADDMGTKTEGSYRTLSKHLSADALMSKLGECLETVKS